MNNQQLIDPQSPVTDEELDQMIWKLERDGGMTPKLLSLMRELREVRRANPICQKCNGTGMADSGGVQPWGEPILVECDCRSAPPAPVVPPEWSIQDAVKFCKESGRQDAGSAMEAWNACRAAMLQAGNSPVTPDGWIPVSEAMPGRDIDVQVYCSDKKEQMVAYMERNEVEGWFRFASLPNGGGVYCKPTHWKPLPEPPVK